MQLDSEFIKLDGRPVASNVLDQYISAALTGVIANPRLLEECAERAAIEKCNISLIVGQNAVSFALGALTARLNLWPSPQPAKKP